MTWLEHDASANRPPGSTTASAAVDELAGTRASAAGLRALARREARRIDDHEVPACGARCAARAKNVERVGDDALVRLGRQAATARGSSRSPAIAGAAMSTDVTRVAPPSAAWSENPPVYAEQVEHGRAGGVAADRAAVVALVEEEAGLLAGAHVDGEPRLVLGDHDLRRRIAAQRLAVGCDRARSPRTQTCASAAPPRSRPASTSGRRGAPERGRGGAVEHDTAVSA